LIEERLKDNDLVAGLDKAHEGREHTLICAGCDCDLLFRIESATEEGGVGIGEGFLQTRSSLGGRVLITFDSIQSTFCSVDDELRRVVAEEALSILTLAINQSLRYNVSFTHPMFTTSETLEEAAASLTIDQTSCFWPATRAAGLKGSLRIFGLNEENRLMKSRVSSGDGAGAILVKGGERDSNLMAIARVSWLYIILPHIYARPTSTTSSPDIARRNRRARRLISMSS
jgi:hypothetical protein